MRILIVNTYYYPEILGGAEYSVKKLAEELVRCGNIVRVLCTGDKSQTESIDGVEVVRFSSKVITRANKTDGVSKYKLFIRRIQDLWCVQNKNEINQQILDFKPDVIHTNGLYDISPIIWKIAHDNNVIIVHTLRDYYLLCPRVSLSCKRSHGEKCLKPGIFCEFHRRINRYHSSYVDVVTAPSSVTLKALTDAGFFKKSSKHVIPNAIDFNVDTVDEILSTRKATVSKKRILRFVYLGTLSEQKGIRWMVDSFRLIDSPEVRLSIAGKGDLLDYVMEMCQVDSRICYEGFLNEDEVSELLIKSDILLCPSQWEEPFGRVVLDAYKHAMPVIASNMGALPDLVQDKESGFIVQNGDVNEFAQKMQTYIENKEIILKHAASGVGLLSKYSIEEQAKCFLNIYSG